ncbi:PREDICTED: endo-1,3(4)-beta-glucanase 1 [Dinoponera quadriceps]|uniref:Endo-1,3(4)-beta-glucanase 1 n=1 Tax=Dinoponera quadriceps TaxID=609295 RepID=A0A6P3YBA4_DINQU|nr:PREDICTED: endo-1,3(4)-beta-glucanase 1 [Dinoponera quadriceps]
MTRHFILFALWCLLFLCPIGIVEAQAPLLICPYAGAFEIYDGTCKNYYICVDDGVTLVPVTFTCAATTVFDPALGKCSAGATCRQTTTPPTCTEIGAFEIYDGTCKNYYICVNNGATLMPVILSCAAGAMFNPALGSCEPGRICWQTTTTTTTTTTPTPTTTAAPCVRYGRFPLPDVNCKMYYLCYWDGLRYTIMSNLSCPNTLVFEPVSEKCVPPERYLCPGVVG